jgi:tRNA threonylcarbamoyladenosine biosynthesis protein TsaE
VLFSFAWCVVVGVKDFLKYLGYKMKTVHKIAKLPHNKAMSEFTFKSSSLDDTQALATAFGAALRGHEVIELISDLGGGKTAFVKGMAKGLRIEDTVQSPTYTISRVYEARDNLELHHFDFYRLNEAGVVADELAESSQDPNAIVAVEWGDIVHDVLPLHRVTVRFVNTGDNTRTITITTPEDDEYLHDALDKFAAGKPAA